MNVMGIVFSIMIIIISIQSIIAIISTICYNFKAQSFDENKIVFYTNDVTHMIQMIFGVIVLLTPIALVIASALEK